MWGVSIFTVSKPAKQAFRDLIRLSQNNIGDSCSAWAKMAQEEVKSPALAYDIGICQERAQDYAAAAASYRNAQVLFGNGKREVAASITRVGLLKQAHDQVEQQLAARRPRPTTSSTVKKTQKKRN